MEYFWLRVNLLTEYSNISDLQEAAEFNFDWSANLKIEIEFGQNPNFLRSAYFINNQSNIKNKIVVHAKMEDNYINGLIRIFGRVPVDTLRPCNWMITPGLSFIGRFVDGIPTGICWRGLIGGAWLYGEVDELGEFTGDQIAYIYPDLKTSLLGRFINGTMVRIKHIFNSIRPIYCISLYNTFNIIAH